MARYNFPKADGQGIEDESPGLSPVKAGLLTPSNMPLVFLITEKGQEDPTLTEASKLLAEFGEATFAENGPYFTHQTRLANLLMKNGNAFMIQRVRPPTASAARIRLSVELIPNKFTWNGVEKVGTRVVWHLGLDAYTGGFKEFANGNVIENFRSGSIRATNEEYLGVYTGPSGNVFTESTLYPIFDMDVRTFGSHGNRTGLVIQPITESLGQANVALTMKSFMYRFQFITNKTVGGIRLVHPTGLGNDFFDACLSQDTVFPRIKRSAFLEDVIAYEWEGSDYFQANPFGTPHVYFDNLKRVLEKLQLGYTIPGKTVAGEHEFDADIPDTVDLRFSLGTDTANAFMINALTGYMFDGITQYRSFKVDSIGRFGGISFSNALPIFAEGGSDGLPVVAGNRPNHLENMRILDDYVQAYMNTFGTGQYKLLDIAMYPISAVYDTGYSYSTKVALLNAAQRRRDVAVFLTPFIYADYVVVDDGTAPPLPPAPLVNSNTLSNSGNSGDGAGTTIPA